jgi:hypothetical protein
MVAFDDLFVTVQYFDSQLKFGTVTFTHSLYSPVQINVPCKIPLGGLAKLSITFRKINNY